MVAGGEAERPVGTAAETDMHRPSPARAGTHARTGLGIGLCVLAMVSFALGDAVAKAVVTEHGVGQFLAVRFVIFAAFAVSFAQARGGLVRAVASHRPWLQITRALVLTLDVLMFMFLLRYLGLAELHALYATAPLMATALAVPILGEAVGWRRWSAVVVGFLGALIIIRPGMGVFGWPAVFALIAAACWAVYHVLTRLASRVDSAATSMLYFAGIAAMVFVPFGLLDWQRLDAEGWSMMLAASFFTLTSHMLLIKALQHAEASLLQPFNYLLLALAGVFGYVFFGELPDRWTVLGASIIVLSGLYVAWREWVRSHRVPAAGTMTAP